MLDYVLEPGKFGEKLVLTGEWDDRLIGLMLERSCTELEINCARGFRGPDIAFLARVPFLTSLVLIAYHLADVAPIHSLHNLRAIDIGTRPEKGEVDFSQFPMLEDCGLEWRPKARSLFGCRSLRRLWLNKYSGHDCSAFRELSRIEDLYLASAPLYTIRELSVLTSLRTLGLYYLRKLASVEGVEGLAGLEVLDVENCRLISSIEPVRGLTRLRRLTVADCGDIQTLEPLNGLPQLEWFLAWGSTSIVDGDLTPLTRLPRLVNVALMNRRHYSPGREFLARFD